MEAYGATECAGSVASTSLWETRAGIVGGTLSCGKLKLRDVPEYGYLSTDDPPRGEVLVKGNQVFHGYFRQLSETKKVLDSEGWYSTGDIAVLLNGSSLQLLDRVKSICKL